MHGIIIIGASGHARVCLDILLSQGKQVIGFCDDNQHLDYSFIRGYPVLGDIRSLLENTRNDKVEYLVAIGNNVHRKQIATIFCERGAPLPINAIHPSAIISPQVRIGYGNFIAPGVVINTDSRLGNFTIINTGATLDHDNVIHDFAQISPGCNIAGNVTIEEGAFLGTGTVVIPGKTIGAYAVIGAGAVVIQDIPPNSTAVGVPARIIK
jgi:sugar O-acyltransferase (sialic acid O-acetyltransferase NeuD family)